MKSIILTVIAAAAVLAAGCNPTLDEPQVADTTTDDRLTTPAAEREAAMREAAAAAREDASAAASNGLPAPLNDPNALSETTLAVQKNNAVTTVEQELAAVDARIQALVSAAEQEATENRGEIDAALRLMRDQRRQLHSLLERMRSAEGAQWQDVQQELRTVYQAFLSTLEQTEEKLGG